MLDSSTARVTRAMRFMAAPLPLADVHGEAYRLGCDRALLERARVVELQILLPAPRRHEKPDLGPSRAGQRRFLRVHRSAESGQGAGLESLELPGVAGRAVGAEHDEDALPSLDLDRLPRVLLEQRYCGQVGDAVQRMRE